jgi:hypothetical protein
VAKAGLLNTAVLENLPAIKDGMAGFLHASVAASTGSQYATGWRVFKAFQQQANQQFTWPLGKAVI